MARILKVLREPPGPCSYLPDTLSSLEHRIMLEVHPSEYEKLMERGIRRFGPDYFAPMCEPCRACEPTRVPVATFAPSRSQKRVLRLGHRFEQVYGVPTVDSARLDLYNKWHKTRENARGWGESDMDSRSYELQFGFPHPCARELTFYDAGRLVAVSICDETPHALSAVYCFHDPEYASFSLGTLNILRLLQRAAQLQCTYVYLGYFVEKCSSLRYKGGFLPQERLLHRPALNETPRWQLSRAPANVVERP